jgi:hypothetical protein
LERLRYTLGAGKKRATVESYHKVVRAAESQLVRMPQATTPFFFKNLAEP